MLIGSSDVFADLDWLIDRSMLWDCDLATSVFCFKSTCVPVSNHRFGSLSMPSRIWRSTCVLCLSTEPHQTYRIHLFIRWNKWGFGCINAFRLWVEVFISMSKTDWQKDNKNMTKMKASLSSVQCSLCVIHLDRLHVGVCLSLRFLRCLKFREKKKKNCAWWTVPAEARKTACGVCVCV